MTNLKEKINDEIHIVKSLTWPRAAPAGDCNTIFERGIADR